MQWWQILIIVVVLLIVGLALHPIRLQVQGSLTDKLTLRVTLRPLGIFPYQKRLVEIIDRPIRKQKADKQGEGDDSSAVAKAEDRAETAENAVQATAEATTGTESGIDTTVDDAVSAADGSSEEAEAKPKADSEAESNEKKQSVRDGMPMERADIRPSIEKVLGCMQIEQLELHANLAGNPYYSGLGCAFLWTFFGGGFAVLSHKVRRFTNKPQMSFGVNIEKPWSAKWDIGIMVRVGHLPTVGIHFLRIALKKKRKNKLAKKTDKNYNVSSKENEGVN